MLDNLKAEEQDFCLLKLCKTKEDYGSEILSMNKFNVNGLCFPEEHYMVHLEERVGKERNL